MKIIRKLSVSKNTFYVSSSNLILLKFTGAIKSIEAHGELLNSETTSTKVWELTGEGNYVIEHGSHEVAVFNSIPADGISQADLMKV